MHNKPHTNETRKKLSELKKKLYKEKGNVIGFQKGNKLAEHPNAVKSRFKKGQEVSFQQRQKISEANRGENNYLWAGGREGKDIRRRVRGCFLYRQWRSDIFKRDDFTCQFCGLRGVYLEADHYPKRFIDIVRDLKLFTLEKALECSELWDLNNGRTLCRKCHDKTKGWKKVR